MSADLVDQKCRALTSLLSEHIDESIGLRDFRDSFLAQTERRRDTYNLWVRGEDDFDSLLGEAHPKLLQIPEVPEEAPYTGEDLRDARINVFRQLFKLVGSIEDRLNERRDSEERDAAITPEGVSETPREKKARERAERDAEQVRMIEARFGFRFDDPNTPIPILEQMEQADVALFLDEMKNKNQDGR